VFVAFLHWTTTVQGDIRPANILVEDEPCSSSKLAGLGMQRLAYVDPWLVAAGERRPQIDMDALSVDLPGWDMHSDEHYAYLFCNRLQ
jgi:hypothetical protein